MDQQLVSAWLQLPATSWPPDHYTLLGLPLRDPDLARIEQRVYERMEIMRRYQLTNPEHATEVMNRLAQALVCLTDPVAKQTYDASLAAQGASANGPEKASADSPTAVDSSPKSASPPNLADPGQSEADWRTSPPTAYPPWESSAPPVRLQQTPRFANEHQQVIDTVRQAPPVRTTPATSEPVPPTLLLPHKSETPAPRVPQSTSSGRLRNRHALFARITRLRRLLYAWEQAGEFLKQEPSRVVNRPADAVELMAQMHTIRETLAASPPILGTAGEAGYHILTLARQEDIVPRLKKLTFPQRESLARDWQAGYELLLENRRVLRQELSELRARGFFGRGIHILAAATSDNIGLLVFLLALVALNIVFQDVPEVRSFRNQQIALFLTLAVGKLIFWWNSHTLLLRHKRKPQRIVTRKLIPAPGLKRTPQTSEIRA